MSPVITLYIFGGFIGAAVLLFIVMTVITALRPPRLPELSIAAPPSFQRVIRSLTPVPFVAPPDRAAADPVAPSPYRRSMQGSVPSIAPSVRVPPFASPQRDIKRPVYPVRRWHTLARIGLVLFATSVLVSGAVVAYPPMLDPLCDDYEWFGAETASVVRQHARDAHAAVSDFIDAL